MKSPRKVRLKLLHRSTVSRFSYFCDPSHCLFVLCCFRINLVAFCVRTFDCRWEQDTPGQTPVFLLFLVNSFLIFCTTWSCHVPTSWTMQSMLFHSTSTFTQKQMGALFNNQLDNPRGSPLGNPSRNVPPLYVSNWLHCVIQTYKCRSRAFPNRHHRTIP